MLSSVPTARSSGPVISGPTTMITTLAMAVTVMQFPMVFPRPSLSLAPKNWATRMQAPVAMPTKSASSRFSTGMALPTAPRAV